MVAEGTADAEGPQAVAVGMGEALVTEALEVEGAKGEGAEAMEWVGREAGVAAAVKVAVKVAVVMEAEAREVVAREAVVARVGEAVEEEATVAAATAEDWATAGTAGVEMAAEAKVVEAREGAEKAAVERAEEAKVAGRMCSTRHNPLQARAMDTPPPFVRKSRCRAARCKSKLKRPIRIAEHPQSRSVGWELGCMQATRLWTRAAERAAVMASSFR